MELSLANLKSNQRKKRKRVGRGDASGHGTYSGRGQKGQKARSGGKKGLKRMGLKQFLQQLPKQRGFKSIKAKPIVVNVGVLANNFQDGEKVTPDKLLEKGLIRTKWPRIKVLGDGVINKKLIVQAQAFSKKAKDAINKAGGKVELIK